ncbi:hypothetical protein C0995_000522 [Termitomyces sp. Mi166|nr:hypothetical protein C0995_000522 [Termitomyces sp. Mi166\
MSRLNDAQVYARQLLPKRHGYPLWVPEPYGNSVSYRTKGVRIGDVGYVTEDGAFETLFNVRASPSDPINCRGVPEGFEQVRIPPEDIVHIPNFHSPEGIVTSANTKKRAVDIELSMPEIPGISPGVGSSFQFTWASSQGAILHLPSGAYRLTCPAELFRDVAVRGAKNWYQFANETLRRGVPNGGLYLITGCDKTASWMVGAFSEKSLDSQVSFNLSVLGCNSGATYSYTWDTSCPAVFRTGPSLLPTDSTDDLLRNHAIIAQDNALFAADAPNGRTQCIFVRGYRLMLRTTPMSLIRGSANKIEVSLISSINPKDVAQSTIHRRYVDQSMVTAPRGSVSDDQFPDHEALSNLDISFSGNLDSEETFLEYLPGETALYHPSTSINELLLRLSPEAVVSLVHDDEWVSVLHEVTKPFVC